MARGTAADVGSEEESREEDEEAESDGDGVAEAEIGEVSRGVRGWVWVWVWSGGGGHWERERGVGEVLAICLVLFFVKEVNGEELGQIFFLDFGRWVGTPAAAFNTAFGNRDGH